MSSRKNILVALDVDFERALEIAKQLKSLYYGLKIGMSLYNKIGPQGLLKFDELNVPLFLDLKFHEIPSVVSKTINTFKQFKNIEFMSVHSMSSKKMIEESVKAAREISNKLNIMAVTILTSNNQTDLQNIGIQNNIKEQVKLLVKFSRECGAQGVISSAQNLNMVIKLVGEEFKVICPGIRDKEEKGKDDQSATFTYSEFNKLANKNTFCVIGRPIYLEGDPLANITKIINSTN